MPRFNEANYLPEHDSSPGHTGLARANTAVVIKIGTREDGAHTCPCGCTEYPEGVKATFRMGHDTKLRGKLVRAHITNTPIVEINGEAKDPTPARAVAERHHWGAYLDLAALRHKQEQQAKADRAAAAQQRRTASTSKPAKASKPATDKVVGSWRKIKVGRWDYTAQVTAVHAATNGDGEQYELEYLTKQGDTKTIRVPFADAQELVAADASR